MRLLDAMSALVIFALERSGDDDARIGQAITRLRLKIEHLRHKQQFGWHACPRCERQANTVICWSCKQAMPERLQRLDALALEGQDRRDVDEQILEWAMKKRRAA